MATLSNGSIPTVKIEVAVDGRIKDEPMDEDAVPYMDDQDDDGGDLDFSGAKRDVWLGRIPRNLWNVLSKLGTMGDDDEIEMGTIRVEGQEGKGPQKVSLLLNGNLPQLANHHREYNLFETPAVDRRAKRKGQTFVFSEQDLPGYKPRKWSHEDVDEDGNASQSISRLFSDHKRSQNNKKRRAEKENEPEGETKQKRQRVIPKKTALQGVIGREFNLEPVRNASYHEIEALQAGSMLHQKKKAEALLIKKTHDVVKMEGVAEQQAANKATVNKEAARTKQARKANQTQRMDKQALQTALHEAFAKHRIWRIRDLRAETKQPEQYLREVLSEMAFQHSRGDFNGMWEMQQDYRTLHAAEMQEMQGQFEGQFEGDVAPERHDVDMEMDVEMDDDGADEEDFEDALV